MSLTIGRDRYNASQAVRALEQLLSQPSCGARAEEVEEQVRREQGVEGACEAIKAVMD